MKPEKQSAKPAAKTPVPAAKDAALTKKNTPVAPAPKTVARPAAEKPTAIPTKLLAKQRVKIAVPATQTRKPAASKASKPGVVALAAPPAGQPARVAARKSSKPGAQRQLIKGAKPRARKAAPVIPPILLEGDRPATPVASGPGERYALGATPPPEHGAGIEERGELPEAYGTQRLLLAARDPHWLYAHWDFTRAQLKKYNALSADRHLVLRVYLDHVAGEPVEQVQVHPESRHWFVHVPRGGARYVAELGYYDKQAKWIAVSVSKATLTPPDSLSDDTSARFANLPVEVPFEQLMALVKAAVSENVPLAEAILELRAEGHAALPDAATFAAPPRAQPASPAGAGRASAPAAGPASVPQWTPTQEKALAEIVTMDSVRRVWMGSLEITELVKRQLVRDFTPGLAAQMSEQLGQLSSLLGEVSSVSSAFGGAVPGAAKSFWFNVNAELIIYGATERDAQVTIGGRAIKLRPDGSFSYRFALPDGHYELPCVAISADQSDGRAAELKFSRASSYFGDVGSHPQDAALKAPLGENVA